MNPVTNWGKILSFMIFCDRWYTIDGRLSSRHTLIARSGFAKSLMMTGVIFDSQSSSESLMPIFITDVKTLGPPPPNSTDFRSSGRTLMLRYSSGISSATWSSSLVHV